MYDIQERITSFFFRKQICFDICFEIVCNCDYSSDNYFEKNDLEI